SEQFSRAGRRLAARQRRTGTEQSVQGENMTVMFKRAALAVLSFTMLSTASAVYADTYPSKPITFVVGYPPGGASDVITRLIAGHMQTALKQPVIVKNQPGVNGNI